MKNPFLPDFTNGNSRNKNIRPDILTALCILTFIFSGLSAISYLTILMSYDMMIEMVQNGEIKLPGVEILFSGGRSYFALGSIFNIVSLWGAILMFRLKRIGFHLYTAAQIFLLIIPLTMLVEYQFSVLELSASLAFIIFYRLHIKYMN